MSGWFNDIGLNLFNQDYNARYEIITHVDTEVVPGKLEPILLEKPIEVPIKAEADTPEDFNL